MPEETPSESRIAGPRKERLELHAPPVASLTTGIPNGDVSQHLAARNERNTHRQRGEDASTRAPPTIAQCGALGMTYACASPANRRSER
ncbi:hypothetical protein QR680_013086 [Steinernema hermaphroditum]|uniref:Uncharacterized protein n=1 Tax=Steinernema hermaphroditum TaxID=289476 RepID=A0AA39I5R5_9BILA|nr:hypothetical protein QR680_013086 [Steinernema hermaphroditum]